MHALRPIVLVWLLAGAAGMSTARNLLAQEPATPDPAAQDPAAEVAALRARLRTLEARNEALQDELARLKGEPEKIPAGTSDKARLDIDLRLLRYVEAALNEKPKDRAIRADAAALAARLAPEFPGNVLVWRVLLATATLRDGMSLADAEKLLGTPTDKWDGAIGWYFNPHGRHVAPCLSAQSADGTLSGWRLGNR